MIGIDATPSDVLEPLTLDDVRALVFDVPPALKYVVVGTKRWDDLAASARPLRQQIASLVPLDLALGVSRVEVIKSPEIAPDAAYAEYSDGSIRPL